MAITGGLAGALWGEQEMLRNPTTALNAEVLRQCVPKIISRAGRDGEIKTEERPEKYQYRYAEKLIGTMMPSDSEESKAKRARCE